MSAYHLSRRLEAQALRQAAAALVCVADAIEASLVLALERREAVHAYEPIEALPRRVKLPADLGRRARVETIERCVGCGQLRIGPAWRFYREGQWHRKAAACA